SSRRRHTRFSRDWSSDVCSSDLLNITEDKVVVYKPHPYLMNLSLSRMREYRNIIVADKYSINEWMLISDAFITDYSSAVFEYGRSEERRVGKESRIQRKQSVDI